VSSIKAIGGIVIEEGGILEIISSGEEEVILSK
jgi:hypothetical protein